MSDSVTKVLGLDEVISRKVIDTFYFENTIQGVQTMSKKSIGLIVFLMLGSVNAFSQVQHDSQYIHTLWSPTEGSDCSYVRLIDVDEADH